MKKRGGASSDGKRIFNMLKQIVSDPIKKERLIIRLSKYVIHKANGCITVSHCKNEDGYARMSLGPRAAKHRPYVHRVFWTLMNKKPIPKGVEIDHECKTRNCVLHLRSLDCIDHRKINNHE